MSRIKIGINSYVTLEEANEYLDNNYISTSLERNKWNSLTDDDKEIYLIDSAKSLNGLKYKGRKQLDGQYLAFPRVNNILPGYINIPVYMLQNSDYTLIKGFGNGDGLESAKEAQIVNAIYHSITDDSLTDSSRKRRLSGISSERAGSVSRSYIDSSNDTYSKLASKGIYNIDKIEAILKNWITGSISTL